MSSLPQPNIEGFKVTSAGFKGSAEQIVSGGQGLIVNTLYSLAVLMIIIGAYKWMASMGDEGKRTEGQKMIGVSVLGVVLVGLISNISDNELSNAKNNSSIANVINESRILDLIVRVQDIMYGFASVAILTAVIYGGFMYMTSGTEDDKASTGIRSIVYAAGGMFLISFSDFLVGHVFYKGGATLDADSVSAVSTVANQVMGMALDVSGIMAIGLLVYAAFQLIFTGAESGKKTAIHAIVGLLVLLLSYGIMQFVFEMIK